MMDDDDHLDVGDNRADMLIEQVVVDDNVMTTIKDVFAGTSVLSDTEKVSKILAVRAEVNQNWSQARDSFLAIGRALLDLENVLSKAEYIKLRQGSERLFPFSDATATQLRRIAKAVSDGVIPLDACPGSYGTAYQITLLNDYQLRVAKERGLIRPDVTRREIANLRKETITKPEFTGRVDVNVLKDEYKKLLRLREKLEAEISNVDSKIHEIRGLLGDLII
jgi:prefoldin subunit 5